MLEVKIKKLNEKAVIPSYSKVGDAGLDLIAISKSVTKTGCVEFGTGLSMEIPEGYVGLIFPRSSISDINYTLANCVGVIDSGYRGEIKARFKPDTTSVLSIASGTTVGNVTPIYYQKGDKIAQMIILPYPQIKFTELEELSETERGEGGFGSTGK